jgi:hypothetical protein
MATPSPGPGGSGEGVSSRASGGEYPGNRASSPPPAPPRPHPPGPWDPPPVPPGAPGLQGVSSCGSGRSGGGGGLEPGPRDLPGPVGPPFGRSNSPSGLRMARWRSLAGSHASLARAGALPPGGKGAESGVAGHARTGGRGMEAGSARPPGSPRGRGGARWNAEPGTRDGGFDLGSAGPTLRLGPGRVLPIRPLPGLSLLASAPAPDGSPRPACPGLLWSRAPDPSPRSSNGVPTDGPRRRGRGPHLRGGPPCGRCRVPGLGTAGFHGCGRQSGDPGHRRLWGLRGGRGPPHRGVR